MTKFRAYIGSHRISRSMDPSLAGYTQSIRKQMASIEAAINDLCNSFEQITPDVLNDALTPTFAKALLYTPHKTGALRASGYLLTKVNGKQIHGEIGFGKGGKPFYAVYVHERTDLKHAEPTRAKWLEAAINEDIAQFPARLVQAYKQRSGLV